MVPVSHELLASSCGLFIILSFTRYIPRYLDALRNMLLETTRAPEVEESNSLREWYCRNVNICAL